MHPATLCFDPQPANHRLNSDDSGDRYRMTGEAATITGGGNVAGPSKNRFAERLRAVQDDDTFFDSFV